MDITKAPEYLEVNAFMSKAKELYVHGQAMPTPVQRAFDPTVGNKFDQEKPRMDLLDANYLEGVANVLTFGAKKYAAHNWRNGIAVSRLIAAAYRHLGAINRGEDVDPESGLPHVYHLGCCTMFLSEMLKRAERDDRYKEHKG